MVSVRRPSSGDVARPLMFADVAARRSEREELAPQHVSALLELARALSGATEHVELAAIAAERIRVLSGASATQVAELRDLENLAVLAQGRIDAPPDRRTA